jgi:hypothetical protein
MTTILPTLSTNVVVRRKGVTNRSSRRSGAIGVSDDLFRTTQVLLHVKWDGDSELHA